jgi:Rad52/22 family double-strand break repair protein
MKNKKIVKRKKVIKKKVSTTKKHSRRQEIVIRVQNSIPASTPTVTDLAEPMKDGKKLTMQKTWLSENQLLRMLQRTPREQVYKRKGRGGGEFDYVTGSYCVKWLNFNFGWNWEYESINEPSASEVIQLITGKIDQIWVTGKLTVHSPDNKFSIIKMQSGSAEIKFKRDTRSPVDVGDDMKAAHTDALKKCASLLGFASDIYGKAGYIQEAGKTPSEPQSPQALPEPLPQQEEVTKCEADGCNNILTPAEVSFSKRMFKGRVLCSRHQK